MRQGKKKRTTRGRRREKKQRQEHPIVESVKATARNLMELTKTHQTTHKDIKKAVGDLERRVMGLNLLTVYKTERDFHTNRRTISRKNGSNTGHRRSREQAADKETERTDGTDETTDRYTQPGLRRLA